MDKLRDRLPSHEERDALALFLRLIPHTESAVLLEASAMVGEELKVRTAPERRHEKLGLLMELIKDLAGEYPTTLAYHERYLAVVARGETPPHYTVLIRDYNGWPPAVDAAGRHLHKGTQERIPDRYTSRANRGKYSFDEVVEAVNRARIALGDWPVHDEFQRFCVSERLLAARFGQPPPRAPAPQAVRNAGGFARSLKEAKRRYEPLAA